MPLERSHDLVITVVKRGWGEKVVKASKTAGAEGGTTIFGRGTGVHEQQTLLGIPIEPEKDIVLTVIPNDLTERVIQAIMEATDLEKPGNGICLVVELKRVAGIAHLSRQQPRS